MKPEFVGSKPTEPAIFKENIIIVVEREEIERRADAICDIYDEAFYDYMNKILDQVREEAKKEGG